MLSFSSSSDVGNDHKVAHPFVERIQSRFVALHHHFSRLQNYFSGCNMIFSGVGKGLGGCFKNIHLD